eukprot:233689-Rhodomonas_salina.1
MTVGERVGSVTGVWSTDLSAVSSMRRTNRAGTGSTSVTVKGSGLGLTTYTGSIRVGVTGCESTAWESETSV